MNNTKTRIASAFLVIIVFVGVAYCLGRWNGSQSVAVISQAATSSASAVAPGFEGAVAMATKVPASWGTLTSVEGDGNSFIFHYLFRSSTTSTDTLNSATERRAVYQVGVPEIYWVKFIKNDTCQNLNETINGPSQEPASYWTDSNGAPYDCQLYSQGFYNLNTGVSVQMKEQLIGSMGSYSGVVPPPFPAVEATGSAASYYSDSGQKRQTFSPNGTYFMYGNTSVKGCAMYLVDTRTGAYVLQNTAAGTEPARMECGATLTFSSDEKAIAVRDGGDPMGSPETFMVLSPEHKTAKVLFAGSVASVSNENVVNDIHIVSLTDSAVTFTVDKPLKDGTYSLSAGTHTYQLP